MDTTQQPPHRTTTTTATDLFTCFTSRHRHNHHSSSSTTKMSPSNPPTSLTASLSHRLKTNRSIKGSPALFSTTKKRFDNPEPSSPKVTCIGQVKIKSKKKARKNKRVFVKSSSFSSSTNENQKWVHLPLTICEGLRSFGSEFSCLFPCFSPPEKEYSGDRRSSGSCAAVCTRWLVVDDCGRSGGGRRRDMELVVSDHEEVDDVSISRVSRRHVFDDLKIVNNNIVEGNDQCTSSSSSSRLSICVPPKNALLLMRCRSDPLKMEALANRLWDSTISQNDDSDDNEDNEQDDDDELVQNDQFEYAHEIQEMHEIQELEHNIEHNMDTYKEQILETNNEKDDECTFFGSLFDENVDQVEGFEENLNQDQEFEENVDQENYKESNMEKVNVCEGINDEESKEIDNLPECLLLMMCEPKLSMEVSKETWVSSKDFFRRNSSRKKPPPAPVPEKSTGGQDESKVSATSTAKGNFQNGINFENLTAAPSAIQPGRSSCSLPVAPSMAEMLEHKLVNAVGYEPFVLTRCKSEPMRTAAAKLAPDNCFWKNRKLEPLRRASFGVKLGATEVGF